MAVAYPGKHQETGRRSTLQEPPIDPRFEKALDELVAICRRGHRSQSEFFNPSDEWLVGRMRVFQDLPDEDRRKIIPEWAEIVRECGQAEARGKPAVRAGADTVVRLDTGGLAFFSQLGVARRPDLTQYFVDGFPPNRDALAFSAENQSLFSEVLPYISRRLDEAFHSGDAGIQTDRRIGDTEDRSFLA